MTVFEELPGTIAAALVDAQAEFPGIGKDSDNPFFHSKYANLNSIIETVQPILHKHGLAVSQWPSIENGEDVLVTKLVHKSGQEMQASMRLYLAKKDPQGQGSAISYARRYALQAALNLRTTDDDDGNAAAQPAPKAQARRKSTADEAQAQSAPDNAEAMAELKEVCGKKAIAGEMADKYFRARFTGPLANGYSEDIKAFAELIRSGVIEVK